MNTLYNKRISGIFMLLGCYLLITVGDALSKGVSGRYPVLQIIAVLGIVSALLLAGKTLLFGRGNQLRTNRPGLLIIRGAAMFVHYFACYYSFSHLPLVNVYSILFLAPVLVTLLSSLLLKEKVGWQIWFAVFAGFSGIMIILRPGLVPMQPAFYVAMATPITATTVTILMRYASRTETNESVLFYSSIMIAICASFLSFGNFVLPSLSDAGLMFGMGLFTVAAWFLMIEGFNRATTPVGAPFQYTQLVWATIFGWIVWRTLPDLWSFVGMAIVVASGLFTLWHEMRLKQAAMVETNS